MNYISELIIPVPLKKKKKTSYPKKKFQMINGTNHFNY